MITPKQLYTPTGKRIVGTAESMLTMHGIDCFGRNVDGSLVFDYNDKSKDYHDTEEQRRDARGERLFQAEDGTDWPESALHLEGEEPKPWGVTITPTNKQRAERGRKALSHYAELLGDATQGEIDDNKFEEALRDLICDVLHADHQSDRLFTQRDIEAIARNAFANFEAEKESK